MIEIERHYEIPGRKKDELIRKLSENGFTYHPTKHYFYKKARIYAEIVEGKGTFLRMPSKSLRVLTPNLTGSKTFIDILDNLEL